MTSGALQGCHHPGGPAGPPSLSITGIDSGGGHQWRVLTAERSLTDMDGYLSPEQANGRPLDGRSDIFSLSLVMDQARRAHTLILSALDWERRWWYRLWRLPGQRVREVPGACQFTGGSGSLKGFKADVTVTTVDFTIWHLMARFQSNRLGEPVNIPSLIGPSCAFHDLTPPRGVHRAELVSRLLTAVASAWGRAFGNGMARQRALWITRRGSFERVTAVAGRCACADPPAIGPL